MGSARSAYSPTGGPPRGPCYVRAAVPGRRPIARGATAAAAAVALALAGCGGADEPQAEQSMTYSVAIPVRSFPARQRLAKHVQLRLDVRNESSRAIPNVAATISSGGANAAAVEAFGSRLAGKGLASRSRPVWIVDDAPPSGETAYANTWALGAIEPHDTRSFTWSVVPVRAGSYTLRYSLTGSTTGRSPLRLADGGAARGSFAVRVSGKPAQVRVTQDGRIVTLAP